MTLDYQRKLSSQMINKKINAVIDLGKSAIRLCVFDEKNKIISSSIEEREYLSNPDNTKNSIKKIIRKSEKQISSHINKITLLIDDPDYFILDLSIKKKIDQIQQPDEIQQTAFTDCSQIISQSYKNTKIINFFINKIFIDGTEVIKLPKNLKAKGNIIFQFKVLCLPNKNLIGIKQELKENNIDIKNILCSSLVRSNYYLNLFKNEKVTAFLDIGLHRSTLILYEDKKLSYLNNISIGSHHITKDISYITKLNLEESEQIKKIFNKSESDFSFSNEDHSDEKVTKKLINKNIPIDLLKKIILARVDEIFKLSFKDIQLSIQNFLKEELLLVLIGRGSKLFDKNTFNFESIENFKDIIFYEENDHEICKPGLEYGSVNKYEIENFKKTSKKQGIFEKFFNLFQKI